MNFSGHLTQTCQQKLTYSRQAIWMTFESTPFGVPLFSISVSLLSAAASGLALLRQGFGGLPFNLRLKSGGYRSRTDDLLRARQAL
jgi:hypothetical protein